MIDVRQQELLVSYICNLLFNYTTNNQLVYSSREGCQQMIRRFDLNFQFTN